MRNRGQLIFGGILVLLGIFTLLQVLLDVDLGVFCWPTVLILLGVWLLFRPQLDRTGNHLILIGDARRRDAWQVENETYWVGIGDVNFDFTQAVVPPGETTIHVYGFIGSLKATVPPELAFSLEAEGFIVDSNVFGRKEDRFFSPLVEKTAGYETAPRKVRLETWRFINDIKVRREEPSAAPNA